MRHDTRWSRRSRRLTALLLAVTVLPAATLIWLGLQLLQRDRSLAAQREQEWRLTQAQSIVRGLERSLGTAEASLHQDPVPSGMVRFIVSAGAVVKVTPADRVLWLNAPPKLVPVEDAPFAEAERFEFQGAPDRAIALYEDAARSAKPSVRAGALFRLARVLRQRRQWDAALAAYRQLAEVDTVAIAGAPADLQARRALSAVLEEAGRIESARRESAALETDFLAGRWLLDHSAWQLTAAELRQRAGHAIPIVAEREVLSNAADALVDILRGEPATASTAVKRRVILANATPVTLLWRRDDRQVTALALTPAVLTGWIDEASHGGPGAAVRVSLLTASGDVAAGAAAPDHVDAVRLPASDTNLPWTVLVSMDSRSPVAAEFTGRRRLLFVGLAAILLLVVGGGYVLWHVLQRELAVARLQNEFVAAVSHEFRTPLTSLRHLTELLEESDDLPADRRKRFYQALGRSTERLHRLVESLLDFSRMEGGRKPYDLRSTDAESLVRQVVADFERETAGREVSISCHAASGDLRIAADAQALTHALWNLLDNAVKYSPDRQIIEVTVAATHDGGVTISVRDRGLGIPLHERKEIFQRFVRGQDATRLGIKGTGLGLAMVSHIVRAHGGRIELDSHPGVGSTFTIVLPADTATRLPKEGDAADAARTAELKQSASRAR